MPIPRRRRRFRPLLSICTERRRSKAEEGITEEEAEKIAQDTKRKHPVILALFVWS